MNAWTGPTAATDHRGNQGVCSASMAHHDRPVAALGQGRGEFLAAVIDAVGVCARLLSASTAGHGRPRHRLRAVPDADHRAADRRVHGRRRSTTGHAGQDARYDSQIVGNAGPRSSPGIGSDEYPAVRSMVSICAALLFGYLLGFRSTVAHSTRSRSSGSVCGRGCWRWVPIVRMTAHGVESTSQLSSCPSSSWPGVDRLRARVGIS